MANTHDIDELTAGMTDRKRNEVLALAKTLKSRYAERRRMVAPKYKMDPDESKSLGWVKCAKVLQEKAISPSEYIDSQFERYRGQGYPMPNQATSLNAIRYYEESGGSAGLIEEAELQVRWHTDMVAARKKAGWTVQRLLDDPPNGFDPLFCFCLALSINDASRAQRYGMGAYDTLSKHPEYRKTALGTFIPEGLGNVSTCTSGEGVPDCMPAA